MNKLKNEWKKYWEDRVSENKEYYGKEGANADAIINLLHITKKDKVLDIGCATGAYLSDIQKKTGARCYGIDISPIPISLNKNKKIRLFVEDMHNIQFENHFFTKIFSLGTIEHSYDTEDILREINRVLRKNGLLYFSVPNKNSFFHIVKNIKILLGLWRLGVERSFTKKQIKSLLNKTGFRLIKFWIEPHPKIANPFNYLDNLLNKLNNQKFGFFINVVALKTKDA